MTSPSAGGGATAIINWRLLGSRNWLNGQFNRVFSRFGIDTRWGAAYQAILKDATDVYLADVMARWDETHNRTGTTLETFQQQFRVLNGYEAQYAITVAGNVGFVINPLPPHVIGAAGGGLWGPQPYTDRYSEFGPRTGPIDWFQGGPESQSPDQTWYQDAVEALAGIGVAGLQTVAGVVKEEALGLIAADGELTSGMVEMHWDL